MSKRSHWTLAVCLAFATAGCDDPPPTASTTRAEAEQTRPAMSVGSVPDTIFNRYIVLFHDDVGHPEEISRDLATRFGGFRFHVYEHAVKGFAIANLPPQAVEALRKQPLVRSIEPDQQYAPVAAQSLPANGDQWGLDRVDQQLGQDGRFNYFFTGSGVHVYIVDSGVYGGHQEFANRLGDGVTKIFMSLQGGPYTDMLGHGTGVASVAAGSMYGIAKSAIIHSVRIDDAESGAWSSDIVAGLDWVAQNAIKPAVANLSYEGNSSSVGNAMQGVINAGVVMVKAAGNGGDDQIGDDACLRGGNLVNDALVVGVSTQSDYKASFSDWGTCVDLFAPAHPILSADREHSSDTQMFGGTSAAAPMTAGVAATILQQRPSANPWWVHNAIRRSATQNVLRGDLGSGSPNLLLNSLHRYTWIEGPTGGFVSDVDQSWT